MPTFYTNQIEIIRHIAKSLPIGYKLCVKEHPAMNTRGWRSVSDYKEIMDNNLAPIHEWIPGWIDTRYSKKDWRSTYKPYDGIWSKPEGKKLEKLLTSCRNQCWDCHECERTFGFEDIDSALQLRKRTDAS